MIEGKSVLNFLPIHVINPRANKEKVLEVAEELESLIDTYGGNIIDRVIQRLDNPDNATFIGKGKVREVVELVASKDVDVVVLNNTAKPRQVHTLKTALQEVKSNIEVWDRVDLILQIFDKHAVTKEAKLQIELARMRYMGPRIYGMGFVLSRQGGGIGTTGVGETNTELMKRHWRSQMKKVTDELKKLGDDKKTRIDRRKKEGLRIVSIVGYTNAGKSSLFKLLTARNVPIENALFVTLDTTIGEVYLRDFGRKVLITDTIGFIRNLPPRLVEAFHSTLLESLYADVLIHLIDASDKQYFEKTLVVDAILKDLKIDENKVIYVLNKTDVLSKKDTEEVFRNFEKFNPVMISVKTRSGIEKLTKKISENLKN